VLIVLGAALAAPVNLPAAPRTVYVKRTQIAVYSGPASYYAAVCFARRGEALKVVGQKGDWVKVRAVGGTGWVFRKALSNKRTGLANLKGIVVDTESFSGVDRTTGIKALKLAALLDYLDLGRLLNQDQTGK
jgi:SH3-like domain-containing protein